MATLGDLEELQDGISASVQTLFRAYDQCTDPVESAAILIQAKQLAAQMAQIETNMFHQQSIQTGPTVDRAFASAKDYTSQLKTLSANLDRVSDIVATGTKLVDVVAQIVSWLLL